MKSINQLAAQVVENPEVLATLGEAEIRGVMGMLTLVAAWYTGTVGHGQQAEIVSYADALMYRPVSDGLPVPTYCLDGPLWWSAPPPIDPDPRESLRYPGPDSWTAPWFGTGRAG